MMKKIKVISCVLTVAIMALIFFFSSQTADESSELSRGLTQKLVEFICRLVGYSDSQFILSIVHGLIRKAAHFTLFFILGLSVANTYYRVFNTRAWSLFTYSLLFCVFYAISDELHQIFVPGRAAMVKDVIIDGTGSMCGIGIFILFYTLLCRRKKNGI